MNRWQHVSRLYHDVLGRAGDERAAFLQEACGGDEALRRDVESLLAQEGRAEGFLAGPALAVAVKVIREAPRASMIGTQLGCYQILSLLGSGGMGEVYRTRDTTLGRDVAIKVLPAFFANDPDRLARLAREARLLAALNHPHIATIHGLEEAGGVRGLVMELVEGPTLEEQLAHGSRRTVSAGLPLADALRIGGQVAEALEAAHEKSVIHRDVKPANIKLGHDGHVKVLDFGVAQAFASDGTGSDLSHLPTVTATVLQAGAIVGTPAYMSPEQARGQAIDKRTDIWAFGCVLYEMLTGRVAFAANTMSDTIVAILEHEPDWTALPASTPLPVDRLLRRCLEKDVKRRLRDIGDARFELAEALRAIGAHVPVNVARSDGAWRWGVVAAASVAVLLTGVLVLSRRDSAAPPWQNPLANATFTRLTDFEASEFDAAISADGKWVAFVSDRNGPFDIWLGQIGSGRFVNLTQGAEPNLRTSVKVVGFSLDGSEVWLHDADHNSPVRVMPLTGGQPRTFLGKQSQNVAWSSDGTRIVYHTSHDGDPMFVADRNGGNARQILVAQPGTHNHHPVWSPDSRWIYFTRGAPTANQMDLWRIAASGGEPERLTHHSSSVGYPAPIDARTVLYVSRDTNGAGPWLWALDLEQKVTHRISFGLEKYTSVAASTDGRRVVATVANPIAGLSSVPILDRVAVESDVRRFPLSTARALAPRFSGTTLFFLSSGGTGDGLWRFQDGQILEIWKGSDGALLEPPAISKDGHRVAFVVRRNGKLVLQVENTDGTDPQTLGETIALLGSPDWSPDGQWIVAGASNGLFKIPAAGGAPVRLATGSLTNPVWSPAGNLILYAGPQVGILAPLLGMTPDGTPVPLPDIKLHRDGERVRFLPDGRGLVYMQGPNLPQDFWLLDLTTRKSRQLTRLNNAAAMRTFDVTSDGKQIVFDRLRDNSDIVLIDLPR